jgi:5-methylphenazine-1-carboxylate 1-monooxygenase
VVRTNREHPPDFINIKVEELTGDKPFVGLPMNWDPACRD